jgi:hypothetical protein
MIFAALQIETRSQSPFDKLRLRRERSAERVIAR